MGGRGRLTPLLMLFNFLKVLTGYSFCCLTLFFLVGVGNDNSAICSTKNNDIENSFIDQYTLNFMHGKCTLLHALHC